MSICSSWLGKKKTLGKKHEGNTHTCCSGEVSINAIQVSKCL